MSKTRMFLIVFFASVLFVTGFVFVQMKVGAASEWIVDQAPSAQVVIVPGASVLRNGSPSDILANRLIMAIELYKSGTVQKVLASGDGGADDYNEVVVMRDYLLDAGIAPEDLFIDHAGFDSYDTMYRARDVFEVNSAIVVSQEYHLPRLLYIGHALGLDVYGVTSDRQQYVKAAFFRARESLANVKAVLEVLIGASPRYLGEAVPISGDGSVTH